jgi:hypothetical protein
MSRILAAVLDFGVPGHASVSAAADQQARALPEQLEYVETWASLKLIKHLAGGGEG